MEKRPLKRFLIRKYVMARDAAHALREDKRTPPVEILQEEQQQTPVQPGYTLE